jgi:hypothetical protein
MNQSLIACLLFVALASSLCMDTTLAATRHAHYKKACPAPAWVFGIEWGGWTNAAERSLSARSTVQRATSELRLAQSAGRSQLSGIWISGESRDG